MQALAPGDASLFGARAALDITDKYLLLILDEIEAVWRTSFRVHRAINRNTGQPTGQPLVDEAFALLWHLANTGYGNVGTLICGSTVSIDRLIKGELVGHDYSDRLSLNGTKFRMTRIVPSVPTDPGPAEECVAKMLPDPEQRSSAWRKELAEFVHWTCGASPRKAGVVMTHAEQLTSGHGDFADGAFDVIRRGARKIEGGKRKDGWGKGIRFIQLFLCLLWQEWILVPKIPDDLRRDLAAIVRALLVVNSTIVETMNTMFTQVRETLSVVKCQEDDARLSRKFRLFLFSLSFFSFFFSFFLSIFVPPFNSMNRLTTTTRPAWPRAQRACSH